MTPEEQTKSLRIFAEQLDERIKKLEEKSEEIKLTEIEKTKKYEDIPTDIWRKIENLWLGNISGISKVRAYRATEAQSIPTGVETKIQLNAESYDSQNEFDSTTNYRFTATKAGYYLVTATIYMPSVEDGKVVAPAIYKNGGKYSSYRHLVAAADDMSASVSDIIYLAVGDYIELYVGHNNSVDKNIWYGEGATWMAIHKLPA